MKIAIIGAGMAGLTAARALKDHAQVTLFDKSRGVGGRMSTRYAGAYEFDHGAQYFTVTDPDFQAMIDHVAPNSASAWASHGLYLKEGRVEPDRGRPRWVGAPRMNALPKALALGLDIELGRRVSTIAGRAGAFVLHFEEGNPEGPFDRVICTTPAPQAVDLIDARSSLMASLSRVTMRACFALMVGVDERFDPGWDSLRVTDLPLSWIAINSTKPGRDRRQTCLVIHGAPDWSDTHAEDDKDWIQTILLETASALCGTDLHDAPHKALHRWLYAYAEEGAGRSHLVDPDSGLILAGDWCLGGRVEGAYLSGSAAAQHIMSQING